MTRQSPTPYSFYRPSNFGRLVVAMELDSMIATYQAEAKVSFGGDLF